MCCCLDEANGLHERVLYCDGDIRAGVAFAELGEFFVVALVELAGSVADCEFEHTHAGGGVG